MKNPLRAQEDKTLTGTRREENRPHLGDVRSVFYVVK